ncbi:hypothetical protein [Bosea sp. RAC05]|uniref:hypothetical protein n=1 Tax=Bosea sp. RAC05 TaxID=1842539 RepID=UPI00083D8D34|nr:hypothetical protein [Bosea sp. RAC05]AOG03072.1 hypothetical protein BSY19_4944 [Bosea sp. RAC05]
MLIKIPFPYQAEVKVGRARNSEKMKLLGDTEVIVREIHSDEAPIALWWTAPDLNVDLQVAIRSVDGDLYHPIFLQESRDQLDCDYARSTEDFLRKVRKQRHAGLRDVLAKPRLITGAAFADVLARGVTGTTMQGHGSTRVADAPPEDIRRPEDANVRHILNSDIEAQAAKIAQFADGLLIIDGIAHRKIAQPGLRVNGRYPSIDTAYEPDASIYAVDRIYQIDRFSEALDDVKGRTGSVRDQMAPPDIVRPDLLDLSDPLGAAARATAAFIVHRQSQDDHRGGRRGPAIASYDIDVIKAWIDVRDADRSQTSAVMAALVRYREASGDQGMLHESTQMIERLIERNGQLDEPMMLTQTEPAP